MILQGGDRMNTNEVASLSGVSVRTLHHYDAIGLLCPERNPENGYREYGEEELDRLQQILFFKECGFPLAMIQKLLGSTSFDRETAFELQKKILLYERDRIDVMLGTLEKTIQAMKGETCMTQKEKFIGFDMSQNVYEEEARRLWGDEVVDQSNANIASKSKEEQLAIAKGMDDLFTELAAIRSEAPDSEASQQAMEHMYQYFNGNFGYQYSPEAFANLGQMYVSDSRFTEAIDRYGEGLASFLAEAMRIYADKKKA